MKQTCMVSILLLIILFMSGVGFTEETTIAVLDFENNSFFDPESYESLSRGLAEIMITELSRVQAVRVVERQKLRSLLDELKLSQSGLIDENSTLKVGKMLGVKHLVFGGYIVTMDKKIRIDVRVVEVETGLTIKASEVTGKIKDMLSLVKKLSKKMIKDLNIHMTNKEKKSIDKSQELDIKAVMFFSKGLEFEDQGQWEQAKAYYSKALGLEPGFELAKKRILKLKEIE